MQVAAVNITIQKDQSRKPRPEIQSIQQTKESWMHFCSLVNHNNIRIVARIGFVLGNLVSHCGEDSGWLG